MGAARFRIILFYTKKAQVSKITILFQIAQNKYIIYPIDVQLQLGLRAVSADIFSIAICVLLSEID